MEKYIFFTSLKREFLYVMTYFSHDLEKNSTVT